MPSRAIQEVLQEHTDVWMALPGVFGVAIGEREGSPCILVYVDQATEQLRAAIPRSVEGYTVVLEETGEFRAL